MSDAGPWPLVGHESLLQRLWSAASRDELAHALLVHGPSGIGKFRAARALAQGLVCAERPRDGGATDWSGPCDRCPPCKRFLSGNHADVFVIDPVTEGVEQIRLDWIAAREDGRVENAESFLALKALESGWRVVIVREAERANVSAQNALLKMLEEPGASVLWVLVSARPERLLATLRSRCVSAVLDPLDEEQTRAVLEQVGAGEEAFACVRWSAGSPGRALWLAQRGAPALRGVLVQLLRGETNALAAAAQIWELEAEFEGATPTARNRDRVRCVLDLALELLRARLHRAAGRDADDLPHGDWFGEATAEQAEAGMRGLVARIDELVEARGCIDLNLDPAATLERALAALEPRRAPRAGAGRGGR